MMMMVKMIIANFVSTVLRIFTHEILYDPRTPVIQTELILNQQILIKHLEHIRIGSVHIRQTH